MGAVQLCLFVMDTHRLPKNLLGKLILETLRISPFKSICMVVTVMSGFNSELYSRDYNRVSFIILVKITLILLLYFSPYIQYPKKAQISLLQTYFPYARLTCLDHIVKFTNVILEGIPYVVLPITRLPM